MRVNLGCGQAYMPGWVNVDPNPDVKADVYLDAVDFVLRYANQVAEVYLGHVLEHLLPGDAVVLVTLLCERLPQGAVVSAVVPDIRAVWGAYERGEITNEQLNASFIYSYVQPSHHMWCYDEPSLLELFRRSGFDDAVPIDPLTWPPVYHKEGPESRWQCGVKATAKGAPRGEFAGPPKATGLTLHQLAETPEQPAVKSSPTTTHELLLRRIDVLRQSLLRGAVKCADQAGAQPVGLRPTERAAANAPLESHLAAGISPSARVGLKTRMRVTAGERLPAGTRRREFAKAALATYRELHQLRQRLRLVWAIPSGREPSYSMWRKWNTTTPSQLATQREYAARAHNPHTAHLLILPGQGSLQRTLDSLTAQSWPHWTASVCLPDAAGLAACDPRVTAAVAETRSAVDAANAAVIHSDKDFVILLRAGDVLAPDCLYTVAAVAHQDPLIDLVSWDDDLIDERGHHTEPRFRPSWSPEMLLGANYLGRSFALRRSRYLWAGGLRERDPDVMIWDLLLRCQLDGERAARVSRVLGSVTGRPARLDDDAARAVTEHLERLGWPATAELDGDLVRVRWHFDASPHVTVLIPTRHNRPMLSACLPSLARTDYPRFDVVIVDNGGRTASNERWYKAHSDDLDLSVVWWDKEPFNYSEVNNAAVEQARGEVLVFLNDDTEVLDPSWMTELVGWVTRPEIGVAGLQLMSPDGTLQHAGAIVGLNGFADHIFAGCRPGSDSLLGSTRWYRNVLAVTGACLAVRKELFEAVGGFDERFVLCGSDVALGLDTTLRGLRNVCSSFAAVRHHESATRGSTIPPMDFFTSYWRYNPWMIGGDPYFSPNLSLGSRQPALRSHAEPTPWQRVAGPLDRTFEVFHQRNDAAEARMLADTCRALPVDAAATRALHATNAAPFDVETVNWFIPGVDSPFYGGINTALRIADELARNHGVRNRFVVWAPPHERFVRSALAAAFPLLGSSEIVFCPDATSASLEQVPYADACIATLWVTAYSVAHFPHTRRKFYLIQDFEPMFHPAGTLYALAEESYRFGLYGICNTKNLLRIYRDDYGGQGLAITPAVDQTVFHANGRHQRTADAPTTVFVYARPGHWRNCWEMASLALEELKTRLGDQVRILTAGSWAMGEGAARDVKHLGLLDYRATGELYRRCDVGLALTVSKHPSYLPLELMACGVPVVAFDNPWGHWILRDGENCLLANRTVDSLADRLERLCVDRQLRQRLSNQALTDIAACHSDWDKSLAGIYQYLCDPEHLSR